MELREHWRSVYREKRPEEVSWYRPSAGSSLDALERVRAGPGCSLVDIGAGASTLADALLDRGWSDVTLIDIAEPALEAARIRLGSRAGKVSWEVADISHWRPGRAFDIWHDRAVFHFLTGESDRAAYRRALLEGTKRGSQVIIATFALDGPERCSGLPVCRYDADGIAAALGADFDPVADWQEAHLTPRGSEQRFQWAVFRRI